VTSGALPRRRFIQSIVTGTAIASTPAWAKPAPANAVLSWHTLTLDLIQSTATDPFAASRALALFSVALLDTARAIGSGNGFAVRVPAPAGLPMAPALAGAAGQMLEYLFPGHRSVLDFAMSAALTGEAQGPAAEAAIAFGQSVADALIAIRDQDGWRRTGENPARTAAGKWRPTEPAFLPAQHPEWSGVTPFVLTHAAQLRPPPPPMLGSRAYETALDTVAVIGAADSATRTPDQTEAVSFWNDPAGTRTPPGHWNDITMAVVRPLRLDIPESAEIFAALNIALADAAIALMEAKIAYDLWRPITALRLGYGARAPLPAWTPLIDTPNHPSYVSGHSAFSAAAATILTEWVGDRSFACGSSGAPGVVRHFSGFAQAAEEAANSRLWGGIHFPFDNTAGLALGRAVATAVLARFTGLGSTRNRLASAQQPAMVAR
jgi:membrane-associated phospholipid phosphatase